MKTVNLLLLLIGLVVLQSCSENSDTPKLQEEELEKQQPVANLDNSSAGLYIGYSTNELVSFKIGLKNGNDKVEGVIHYYGELFDLIPDENLEAFIANDAIEGTFSFEHGDINLSIGKNGEIISVEFDLEEKEGVIIEEFSDNADILKKKTSTNVLNVYSGTWKEEGVEYYGEDEFPYLWSADYTLILDGDKSINLSFVEEGDECYVYSGTDIYEIKDGKFIADSYPESLILNGDKLGVSGSFSSEEISYDYNINLDKLY